MTTSDPQLIDYLVSLKNWTRETATIVARISRDSFLADRVLQLALCKAVEQCGEVCSRIVRRWPDVVDANPHIEFRRAVALRHRIAHAYEGLDLELIWSTATISIPELHHATRTLLPELGCDDLA